MQICKSIKVDNRMNASIMRHDCDIASRKRRDYDDVDNSVVFEIESVEDEVIKNFHINIKRENFDIKSVSVEDHVKSSSNQFWNDIHRKFFKSCYNN